MKITKHVGYDGAVYRIHPFKDSFSSVDLYMDYEDYSRYSTKRINQTVGINWPAIGTKSAKETRQFAKALLKAVELIPEIKKEVPTALRERANAK